LFPLPFHLAFAIPLIEEHEVVALFLTEYLKALMAALVTDLLLPPWQIQIVFERIYEWLLLRRQLVERHGYFAMTPIVFEQDPLGHAEDEVFQLQVDHKPC
jgi:hypothetical protein